MALWTDIVGIVVYAFSGVVLAMAYFIRGYRDQRGSRGFVVMLFAVWLWLVAYGTALLAYRWINPLWAYNLVLLAASLAAVGSFISALSYTRQYVTSAREIAALLVIPTITQIAAWTNPYHHLIWAPATTVLAGGGVNRVYGLLFFVPRAVYSYGLAFTTLALLGLHAVRTHGVYRKRSLVLLVSGLLVPLTDIVHVTLKPLGPVFYLTPIAFFQFTVVVMWILYQYRFLDLAPIARQQAVEAMKDGVLVVDETQQILDVNGPGRELLQATKPVVGNPIADYHPEVARAIERTSDRVQSDDGIVTVEDNGNSPVYDLNITQFSIGPEQFGHIVVVRDVTDREHRENELQRKNERLDQFASVVSYDLRNPLSVISGHLDLIRDTAPEEDVEAIAQNLNRMDAMIDDLLTMTRAGQSVEDTESVPLVEVARAAWSHADTTDCTFDCRVTADVIVEADRGRLLHVFENLFRNAIDHNDPPLTVTVGRLDSTGEPGFYVADDGDGIPPEEREKAFEHGYTTNDDGSGLGLAIVADIVDGHDWTIRIVESAGGGARFNITGVTIEPQA